MVDSVNGRSHGETAEQLQARIAEAQSELARLRANAESAAADLQRRLDAREALRNPSLLPLHVRQARDEKLAMVDEYRQCVVDLDLRIKRLTEERDGLLGLIVTESAAAEALRDYYVLQLG
jgi:hypothetical protein